MLEDGHQHSVQSTSGPTSRGTNTGAESAYEDLGFEGFGDNAEQAKEDLSYLDVEGAPDMNV